MNYNSRQFSFGEVVRLSGLTADRIHGMIHRGRFKPQYKILSRGIREKAYTGKDVLKLILLAPIMEFGLRYSGDPTIMKLLLRDLDRILRTGKAPDRERLLYPKASYAPWAYVTLDLDAMVSLNSKRLEIYLELRENGVGRDGAVKASLDHATKSKASKAI